jgi:hypothetical protein
LWWLLTAFQQRITDKAILTGALTDSPARFGRATAPLTLTGGNIRAHQASNTVNAKTAEFT